MRFVVSSVSAAIVLFVASAASAQATVDVRVVDSAGRPSEGRVRISGSAGDQECRTNAGHCTMLGVAPGVYEASLAPVRESPPPPRTIEVPANGTIVLALASRATSGTPTEPTATTATATPIATATTTGTVTVVARPTTTTARPRRTTTTRVNARPTATTATTRPMQTGTNGTVTVAATTPVVTTATQQTNTTTTIAAPRDLTSGIVVKVQGTVTDGAGRPCDARMVVRLGGTVIGTANSTAGSFSLYDLGTGDYSVEATSVRNGSVVQVPLSVGAATSRLIVRLP